MIFSIQNDLKQGDALSALLFNFVLQYAIRKVRRSQWPSGLRQWYSTFFPPVPLETLFHSTLYPQNCWCIIQVIHNYI
jgi:hypothetical protein